MGYRGGESVFLGVESGVLASPAVGQEMALGGGANGPLVCVKLGWKRRSVVGFREGLPMLALVCLENPQIYTLKAVFHGPMQLVSVSRRRCR